MRTMTWTAGNGKEITIEITSHLCRPMATSFIGGKRDFSGEPYLFPAPKTVGDKVIVGAIGAVGLTQDRYDELMRLMSEVKESLDSNPEVILHRLIERRYDLARDLTFAQDDAHDHETRRIEEIRASGRSSLGPVDLSGVQTATKALADFDAAYPEIIVKITADRQAETERFARTN